MSESNDETTSCPSPPLPESRLADVVECLLFVGSDPIAPEAIQQAFPEITLDAVLAAIDHLSRTYQRQKRPYAIVRKPSGYRLEIREPYRRDLATKIRGQRSIKLARGALDVLSVVAYRQPIEAVGVREIVGMDPNSVLRQLVRRGLLTTESAAEKGQPVRYVTTERFLEIFNIESLADVPGSDDLERL